MLTKNLIHSIKRVSALEENMNKMFGDAGDMQDFLKASSEEISKLKETVGDIIKTQEQELKKLQVLGHYTKTEMESLRKKVLLLEQELKC